MKWSLPLVVMALLGLSGCGGPELDQLDATLHNLRVNAEPGLPEAVKPLPAFTTPAYRHAKSHSPFLLPETSAGLAQASRPAPPRLPEPLEHFALAELRLVGTLAMGKQRIALIEAPGGQVISAYEGGYLGGDEGRITQITEQAVHIVQRAATPEGMQVRRVSLALDTPHQF